MKMRHVLAEKDSFEYLNYLILIARKNGEDGVLEQRREVKSDYIWNTPFRLDLSGEDSCDRKLEFSEWTEVSDLVQIETDEIRHYSSD